MSHYFRTAAQCDLSVAAKAPMPLYNDDVATRGEGVLLPTADLTESAQRGAARALTGLDDFARSRAALDRPQQEAVRRAVKREANVLANLARKTEAQRIRSLQEEELHAKLMSSIVTSKTAASVPQSEPESVVDTEKRGTDASKRNDGAPVGAADLVGAADTLGDQSISMFDRIKIEEARCLRRSQLLGPVAEKIDASYGGSIVSLYNALTLESALQEDPVTPPSVLFAKEANNFLLPSNLGPVPTVPFIERQASSEARAEELASRLQRLHEMERTADALRRSTRDVRDVDAATVLRETLEQDHARREYLEGARLLRIAQYHQSSLLGAFDVDNRTDPLLPHFPANVMEAMQFAKKPPHPVDLYQAAVRDRRAVDV